MKEKIQHIIILIENIKESGRGTSSVALYVGNKGNQLVFQLELLSIEKLFVNNNKIKFVSFDDNNSKEHYLVNEKKEIVELEKLSEKELDIVIVYFKKILNIM